MKTTTKGKIAEYRFVSEFMKKGIPVFLPTDEWSKIDMIVMMEDGFKTVQIKYCTPTDGVLTINNKSSGLTGNYYKNWYNNEIDLFGVYDAENDKGYIFPVSLMESVSCMLTLRIKPTKNNQKKGVHLAKDYIFF